jgi:VWFA-related protein
VQPITQFTTEAQPLSVLLLLDGSSSMMSVFRSLIEGANSFILRMLPADRAAIASFSDRFQMRQPFTSNRDELLAHLQNEFNVRVGGETRLWLALDESVRALSPETGRRVVLVMSDGKNWAAGAPYAQTRRGPAGSAPKIVQVPSAPDHANPAMVLSHSIGRDVMVYAVAMWTFYEGRPEAPDNGLLNLAEQTGGGFVELREADDIGSTFTRIAQELHQQYILGFTPQVLDGKTHRIEVRVKRPGVKVRARRSYVAQAEK